MRDALTDALNSTAGHLAETLIRRAPSSDEMPKDMRERFDKLALAEGRFGKLARIRLAAEVSILFERMPNWTTERILPSFSWQSPEAASVWSARRYSNFIGSPKLFELTKVPFLELFARSDVSEDDLRIYGEWLVAIMVATRSQTVIYPITAVEARSALRSAGERAMSSAAHRLAIEMERAEAATKMERWRDVVGPVFESIWPLDAELQSPSCTFNLVHILRASGPAFPASADTITPFVRPEDPRRHTSLHSISTADDAIYASSPEKVLDLAAAVVGDTPSPGWYGLTRILERIQALAPHLSTSRKFQRLLRVANGQ